MLYNIFPTSLSPLQMAFIRIASRVLYKKCGFIWLCIACISAFFLSISAKYCFLICSFNLLHISLKSAEIISSSSPDSGTGILIVRLPFLTSFIPLSIIFTRSINFFICTEIPKTLKLNTMIPIKIIIIILLIGISDAET